MARRKEPLKKVCPCLVMVLMVFSAPTAFPIPPYSLLFYSDNMPFGRELSLFTGQPGNPGRLWNFRLFPILTPENRELWIARGFDDNANPYLPQVPMEIDPPFDPAALGLKEIGNLASWTVSSCKPGCGVEALRDENTDLFWQ